MFVSRVSTSPVATTLVVVVLFSLLLIVTDVGHANQGRQSNPTPALNPTMAPDFTLQDVNGKGFRLSDLRGKVVVLEFMSTTCPHCQNEMSQLVSVWKSYGSSITMISVDLHSSDTDDTLKSFASSYNAPWVWARDTTGVNSAYQVQGVPEIFIINTSGQITATFAGETSETALSQQIQTTMQPKITAPTPTATRVEAGQGKEIFLSGKPSQGAYDPSEMSYLLAGHSYPYLWTHTSGECANPDEPDYSDVTITITGAAADFFSAQSWTWEGVECGTSVSHSFVVEVPCGTPDGVYDGEWTISCSNPDWP